jgi:hypothetical protein
MNLRNWKRIALLGAIMGTCFTAGVYAQDTIEQVQAYLRKDFNVVVNGTKVSLTNTPLVYNNNSYLPVKELASYLGASISWKGDTKTIYINSRINPQQPVVSDNIKYDEISLTGVYAYYLTYLGAEYPVLTTSSDTVYYRENDVLRMGINTQGLRKAKEKFTEELYISEQELSKHWQEKPDYSYTNTRTLVITGEKDEAKLEALTKYTKSMESFTIGNVFYFRSPVIIDALPAENEYSYIYKENNHFYRAHLKLTTWDMAYDGYLVDNESTEDLEIKKVK